MDQTPDRVVVHKMLKSASERPMFLTLIVSSTRSTKFLKTTKASWAPLMITRLHFLRLLDLFLRQQHVRPDDLLVIEPKHAIMGTMLSMGATVNVRFLVGNHIGRFQPT